MAADEARRRGRRPPQRSGFSFRRRGATARRGAGRRGRGLGAEPLERRTVLAAVIAAPESLLATEDVPLSIADIQVSDPDAPAGEFLLRLEATTGRLTMTPAGGGASIIGNDSSFVVYRGTLDSINTTLETLVYASALDVNGPDELIVDILDLGQTVLDSATVPITVAPANDPPVRTSPTGTLPELAILEDGANVVAQPLFAGITSPLTYSAGPSNESDQTLTYTITGVPSFLNLFKFVPLTGNVPVAANDVLTLGELRGLLYTTVPDANGVGAVTWRVTDGPTDGTAALSLDDSRAVRVDPVNDAPVVINPDSDRIQLLPTVPEDSDPAGRSVESLFLARFSDPRDDGQGSSTADEFAGVAVSLYAPDPAKGSWQFKDGVDGVWNALGEVPPSTSFFVFVRRDALLRFKPALNYNGPAPDVTVHLADSSGWADGVFPASGTAISPAGAGFATPYSEDTLVLWATVTAVPDAPLDIELVTTPFNNVPLGVAVAPGTTVGTLRTLDPDSVDQTEFRYALVSGEGDDHNEFFRISTVDGRLLEVRTTPGFYPAGGAFSVRVRSTGADGLGFEKVLTIAARPLVPAAPDLAATSDSGRSDIDDYTNVTTPTFLVDVPSPPDGGVASVSLFVRRPGSATIEPLGLAALNGDGRWEFTVPAESRFTTNGVYSVTARVTATAGGTSDDSAALAVTVDTRGARIAAWSTIASPRSTPLESVTATFDEAVFVPALAADVKAGGFQLTNTVAGRLVPTVEVSLAGATITAGSGSTQWTLGNLADRTSASGRYDLALEVDRSTFTDLAGNPIRERAATFWLTDSLPPTVVNIGPVTPTVRSSPVGSLTVTFSEPVTGFGLDDLRLTLNNVAVTLTGVTVGGGSTAYTVTGLAPLQTQNGAYRFEVVTSGATLIRDLIAGVPGNALQAGAAVSWSLDQSEPEATFRESGTPEGTAIRSPRGQAVQGLVLSFSEPVTGVEATDLVLTLDGAPVATDGLTLSPSVGAAATFVVGGLGPLSTAAGTYVITLRRNAGTPVADASGNRLAADVTATWTVDTTAPEVVSFDVAPTPGLSADRVETAQVEFLAGSFAGVALDNDNFRLVRNGSSVSLAGAGVTEADGVFTLTLPVAATGPDGRYVLTLVASGVVNELGNRMAADRSVEWQTDATEPTVTLDVVGRTGSGAATVFTIRALFSEAVTGFDPAEDEDVDVGDGTVVGAAPGGDGVREFRFTVRPDSDLPVAVSIPTAIAADGAGNPNLASNALRLVTDFTPPQVTIVTARPITNESPIVFTATFTEPVEGLVAGDVVVTNGTVEDPLESNPDGTIWTIMVTPDADGVVTVYLPAAAAVDRSDNPSVASNVASVVSDGTPPKVVLTSLSGAVSRANRLRIAARFTEEVTGVGLDDLAVTGGSVISFTGAGLDYVFVVVPDADGTVEAAFPADAAFDRAENGNLDSNPLKIISDRTPPEAWLSGPEGGIVTVTFSEPVAGFDFSDLVLWQGTRTVSMRGTSLREIVPGEVWEFDIGAAITLTGDFRLTLLAANAGITDVPAGNRMVTDAELLFTIDNQPPAALITGIPRITGAVISAAGIVFTEPVTGVDVGDFQLLQNGVPINLTGVVLSPQEGPAVSYTLTGLNAVASADATYVLRLMASNSGIEDASGNALVADASATWRLDTIAPVAELGARVGDAIGPVPSPRSTAVTTLDVRFDQRVQGLDISDFTLLRDGVAVRLAGATLAPLGTSGREFRISGLSPLTRFAGEYEVVLRAAGTGILDAAGNALAVDATAAWTNNGTLRPGALAAAFAAVVPNPRSEPLAALGLSFTAPVTGVDLADFVLARTAGGLTTELTGFTVARVGSASRWEVRGMETLTLAAGDYALRLRAAGSGIATAAGVPLAADAVVTWTKVMVGEPPKATVELDPAVSPGAAIDSVTIRFSEAVTGVGLEGFRLFRDGVAVNLTGTVLTPLTSGGLVWQLRGLAPLTASAATYELRLVAKRSVIRDLDGNLLDGNASTGAWTQAVTTVRAAFLGVKTERARPLAAAKVRFSVPVKGVDLRDFELHRDGVLIRRLTGVTISGSGDTWTIDNLGPLQAGPGLYELTLKTLSNDIVDDLGNRLAEPASLSWRIV